MVLWVLRTWKDEIAQDHFTERNEDQYGISILQVEFEDHFPNLEVY
jgi:hypothetical protein